MKRFVLMLMIFSAGLSGQAQNKMTRHERMAKWKNDMKEFKNARKKNLEAGDSISWFNAQKALGQTAFVLEADAVTFRDGTRIIVNSTTNFISVNGKNAVVQVSPSTFVSGPNGLGGITVDGSVSAMSVSTDKKGCTQISMNVTGVGINARVDITLYPESNKAYAVVSPTFNSQTVRLEGYVVPLTQSRTVEGMSL